MKNILTIAILLITMGSFASNGKVEKIEKVEVAKSQATEYRESLNAKELAKFRAQYLISKPSRRTDCIV